MGRRTERWSLILILALSACDDAAVGPTGTALVLQIEAPQGASLTADQATIHLEGPTSTTRTAQPGESVTLDRLLPGSYTVAVEGMAGPHVEWFDELQVTVTTGNTTTRTAVARSFVPANFVVGPSTADPGQPFSLQWDPVTGAENGYRVEFSEDPGFTAVSVSEVAGTSLEFPAQPPGDYYFRVRAVNRFGSESLASSTGGVAVEAPILEPNDLCSENPDYAIASFEDDALEAAVVAESAVAGPEELTCELVGTLTELSARNADISNVVGLQNLTGLTDLDLSFNPISDIDPLSGLTNLTSLQIRRFAPSDIITNRITDISALGGLTNLRLLDLFSNEISEVGPLSGLTSLEVLDLGFNPIGDISHLGGLGGLTDLRLSRSGVGDITALAGLTSLTRLDLSGNDITEIGALSGLEGLTELNLGSITFGGFPPITDSNAISDIGPLSGLTNLTVLDLDLNSISDLSPLDALTNLTDLDLAGNEITDIGPLSGLTSLTDLDLGSVTTVVPPNPEAIILGANSISDLDALSGLTSLVTLDLTDNPVSDIQPLLANSGLGPGDEVNLKSTQAPCADVAALQARGPTVFSDCPAGLVTIAEARGLDGVEVTVEGVVTWRPPWDTRIYFLQDATGGIAVFHSDNVEGLARGERIRMTGTISSFQGEVQVSTVTDLQRLGVEGVPLPRDVTGDQVNADEFQGELVHVEAEVRDIQVFTSDDQLVTLRDGVGTDFLAWTDIRTGILPGAWPPVGSMVEVTGVLGTDNQHAPPARLELRDPDDLVPMSAPEAVDRAVQLFECALASYIVGAGLLGDELADGQTWEPFYDYDRRTLGPSGGLAATLGCAGPSGGIVRPLQEAHDGAELAVGLLPAPSGPDEQAQLATALTYQGYSTLLMAEGFCTASPDPTDPTFEEALARFDEALAWAGAAGDNDLSNLARVGQARARQAIGDFAGAAASAAQVPTSFEWHATYDESPARRRNHVYDRITRDRELTVEEDVREFPDMPVEDSGMMSADGTTPHWNQTKYTASSPILMAHGREARLIQAETAVNNGDLALFTSLVNEVRVFDGLAPVPNPGVIGDFGGDDDDALSLLLRERTRVLFLEGRHLGDWRRWNLEFTPPAGGAFKDGSLYGDSTCFPSSS